MDTKIYFEESAVDSTICRCCQAEKANTFMWQEYKCDGDIEIYGQMLTNSFIFPEEWPRSDGDTICEICVMKLREAYCFRNQVLEANFRQVSFVACKLETEYDEDVKPQEVKEDFDEEIDECIIVKQNDELPVSMKESDDDHEDFEDDVGEEYWVGEEEGYDFQNVEYLMSEPSDVACKSETEHDEDVIPQEVKEEFDEEIDFKNVEYLMSEHSDGNDSDEDSIEAKRRGHSKTKRLRPQIYLQYTQSDLRQAIKEVKTKTLSFAEASKKYNIPKNTIINKIRGPKKAGSVINKDKTTRDKRFQTLLQEIISILTYTNVTPFKSRTNRVYCAYCVPRTMFDDVAKLREHTKTKHFEERVRAVDQFMRPHWANETLKVDVNDLICTLCCIVLPKWNDLFKHLSEVHHVDLVEAKTHVIPFRLSNSLMDCFLCKATFNCFHNVDGHMNEHYSNFVCQECGDTCITKSRFAKHLDGHNKGNYPCPTCGKVFELEKYMKKHYNFVHSADFKWKCFYCGEGFDTSALKEAHVLKHHKAKYGGVTCEMCGIRCDSNPIYVKHLKSAHKEEYLRKFGSLRRIRDSKFAQNATKLKQRREKNHVCLVCSKKYVSIDGVINHMKKDHSELRILVKESGGSKVFKQI